MENYSQRSQEEIAKLTQSRVESDAKKIKEGARFVLDKGISTPRLEFTKQQIEKVRLETTEAKQNQKKYKTRRLALRLVNRLVRANEKIRMRAPEVIIERDRELLEEARQQWREVLPPTEREESRILELAFREAISFESFRMTIGILRYKFLQKLIDVSKTKPISYSSKLLYALNISLRVSETEQTTSLDSFKIESNIPEEEFKKLVELGRTEAEDEYDEFVFFAELLGELDSLEDFVDLEDQEE